MAIAYAVSQGWAYVKRKGKGHAVGIYAVAVKINATKNQFGEHLIALKTTRKT
ncbi:hypothetical protein [Photorhabdus akhurstii]|uniref:hypothetical protein n=1 Tax=Photorhabdus akhurstii TaxID=171438 RepID=UPI0021576A69